MKVSKVSELLNSGLEGVRVIRTVGSNPTLSAIKPYLSISYAIVSAIIPVPIYGA